MPQKTRKEDRLALYQSSAYRAVLRRLASNLRRLREARGWTQERASEECAMPLRVYQLVENERTNVTAVTVARFLEGFRIDVDELFGKGAPVRRRLPASKRAAGRQRSRGPR